MACQYIPNTSIWTYLPYFIAFHYHLERFAYTFLPYLLTYLYMKIPGAFLYRSPHTFFPSYFLFPSSAFRTFKKSAELHNCILRGLKRSNFNRDGGEEVETRLG